MAAEILRSVSCALTPLSPVLSFHELSSLSLMQVITVAPLASDLHHTFLVPFC